MGKTTDGASALVFICSRLTTNCSYNNMRRAVSDGVAVMEKTTDRTSALFFSC
ncbi:hypothetical protein BaRGS_00010323, partial [Batillaria attramentaria]